MPQYFVGFSIELKIGHKLHHNWIVTSFLMRDEKIHCTTIKHTASSSQSRAYIQYTNIPTNNETLLTTWEFYSLVPTSVGISNMLALHLPDAIPHEQKLKLLQVLCISRPATVEIDIWSWWELNKSFEGVWLIVRTAIFLLIGSLKANVILQMLHKPTQVLYEKSLKATGNSPPVCDERPDRGIHTGRLHQVFCHVNMKSTLSGRLIELANWIQG